MARVKEGKLRRAFTGRMDVLSTFVGYNRTGERWWPHHTPRKTRNIQPDASFWTIRADALALAKKGLLEVDSEGMQFTITQAGIDEWNRLWPDHPARVEADPPQQA